MLQRLTTALVLGLTVTAAFGSDETQRCTASAKVCEQKIRTLFGGMPYFGAKLTESRWGLVVHSVAVGSPAGRAGFRPGDRIFAVNGRDASKADIAEFKRMLSQLRGRNGRVTFAVVRGNTVTRITAHLVQPNSEQIEKVIDNHLKEAHRAPMRAEKNR